MSVRCARTSENSKGRLTKKDLAWADLVFVMEPKYAGRIRTMYPLESLPPLRSLDIPDDYEFLAPELMELLTFAVEHEFLDARQNA